MGSPASNRAVRSRVTAKADLRLPLLGLLLLAGPGCTVFGDYNVATEDARQAFKSGDFATATKLYSEELDASNDSLLYHLEAGLSAHAGKAYPDSMRLFAVAYRKVEDYQNRALVSASDVAQTVGSFLVNEKTIPYTGTVFEQLMLQTYQARNLFLADRRDGVITEVLRTYDIQKKARQIYEEELKTAESKARSDSEGVDVGEVRSKMQAAYDYGDLSDAEDVYDLRYVRYLNAWLREATADRGADYNAALIDLKYVADRFSRVDFIQRDLARMTAASGDPDGGREVERRAGLEPLPRGAGSVALFFESGMAPRKSEIKVIFPTLHGASAVAMPRYDAIPNPVAAAILVIGDEQARTVTLTHLEKVAFRYHKDRLPLMIAKQIIRAAAKIGIQEGGHAVIANQDGQSAEAQILAQVWSISTSIWNVVSEQADLRCWRTLPQTCQATRLYLPPGTYPAKVVLLGAGGNRVGERDLGLITIEAGRHRMINARSIGTSLYVDVPREPYDAVPVPAPTPGALPGPVEGKVVRDVLVQDEPVRSPEPQAETPVVRDVLRDEPAADPSAGEPQEDEVLVEDPLAPSHSPGIEGNGDGDVLTVYEARFRPGGPLSIQVQFEDQEKGEGIFANTTVAQLERGRDARGAFLTITTPVFRNRRGEHFFTFVIREDRIERVELMTGRGDRFSPAPAQVFAYRPRAHGTFDVDDRGVVIAQPAVVNRARGERRRATATLVLRSFAMPGARDLDY